MESKKHSSRDNTEELSEFEDDIYLEDDTFYIEAAQSPTPFAPRKYNVLSLILSLQSTDSVRFSSLIDIPLHPITIILVIVISFLCLTGIILLILRVYVLPLLSIVDTRTPSHFTLRRRRSFAAAGKMKLNPLLFPSLMSMKQF